MNLYLISQTQNNDYDTYDSAVVAAYGEDEARHTNPNGGGLMTEADWGCRWGTWCHSPEHVTVRLIGAASEGVEPGVVCASFNAG